MNGAEQARERLELSRERIRRCLSAVSTPRGVSTARASGVPFAAWMASLRALPIAGVLLDAVGSWWTQHPLRIGALVASEGLRAVARPLAQRSPFGLVAGALVVGAALAWSRPWRWLLRPVLFTGLAQQLVAKLAGQLPPLSWAGLLDSVTRTPSGTAHAAAPPAVRGSPGTVN